MAENQNAMEELIYPVTLPSSIHTFTGLDSANVLGSDDPAVLIEHNAISRVYVDILSDFFKECGSRGELYDK